MSAPSTTNFIASVLQSLSNNFFTDLTNSTASTTTSSILSNALDNTTTSPTTSPPTPTLHPLSFPSLVASFNNFDNSSMSMRSERGNMTIRRMLSPPTDPAATAQNNNGTPTPPPVVVVPPLAMVGAAHPPPPHLLGGAAFVGGTAPFTPANLPCIQFTTNLSNSYSTIVSTRNSRTIETHSSNTTTTTTTASSAQQPHNSNTSIDYIFYTKHTHPDYTYFEVKLADKLFSNNNSNSNSTTTTSSGAPEVALGFAPFGYKGMVGWLKNSIGFHVDNGRVYDEKDATNKIADRVFMGTVNRGDVIGCLMNHTNGEFLVVKNGQEMYNRPFGTVFKHEHFKQAHHFLPTISCSDIHLEMEVNLGLDMVRKPFVYPRVVHFRQRERLLSMVVVESEDSCHHHQHQHQHQRYNFTDVEIITQCSNDPMQLDD